VYWTGMCLTAMDLFYMFKLYPKVYLNNFEKCLWEGNRRIFRLIKF
jgi:hypothetical protein